ncbi:hypothetical protein AOQ84DRAFT_418174 [Glonium stellatum]|uniref:Uncharacterized protein n=1 Tax=Glonium stellatum TaxID=574774 RepID=A0A8E2ESI0_9PEZI|nr:hypothetical protein AOQ84DRAFT_418174 [Glonium stellatum]
MAFIRLIKDIKNAAKTDGLSEVTAVPKTELSALQESVLQKCYTIEGDEKKIAGLERKIMGMQIEIENLTGITAQRNAEIARLQPFEEEAMRLRPRIGPLQDQIMRLNGELRTSKESAEEFKAKCELLKKHFAVVQSDLASWKRADEITAIESRYRDENLKMKAKLEATIQGLVLGFASKIKTILNQNVDAKAAEHQIGRIKPSILLETPRKESGISPDDLLSASDKSEKEGKTCVMAIFQGLKALAMCSVQQKAETERQEESFSMQLKTQELQHASVIAEFQVQEKKRSLQLQQERKSFNEEKEAIDRQHAELIANIRGRNVWASELRTHLDSIIPLLVIDFQGAIDVLSRAIAKISTNPCHWYVGSRMEKNLKELLSSLREEQRIFSERTQLDNEELILPDGLRMWTATLKEMLSNETALVVKAVANYFYARSRGRVDGKEP